MVQSYLEGVGWGLEQLREARAELKEVSRDLKEAGLESNGNADGVKSLEGLREVSVTHCQLLAAVSNLPRLYSGGPPLRIHSFTAHLVSFFSYGNKLLNCGLVKIRHELLKVTITIFILIDIVSVLNHQQYLIELYPGPCD